MSLRLTRRSLLGILLVLAGAIVTAVLGLWWVCGYCCGFIHAWLTCIYTVRWTVYRQARAEAMREAFWS